MYFYLMYSILLEQNLDRVNTVSTQWILYIHSNRYFLHINNLRYADDTTLKAESEELKSLLMKVKEESEKVDLKLNIQNAKIMVSGPISSLQIDGETVETASDFIFLGSKITADGDCSMKLKDTCFLEEKL